MHDVKHMELVFIIAFVMLVIATITDLRTLEVPDWLSYAGIALGLAIHAVMSAMHWTIWPLANSAIGLAIAFSIACLMFYSGQWGGGDAKLLMAMGALVGFDSDKFGFGASFLLNLLWMGAIWGIAYTLFLAARNLRNVSRTARTLLFQSQYARVSIMSTIIAVTSIVLALFVTVAQKEFAALAVVSITFPALIIITKATELSAMHKWVTPDQLVEGDWMVHTVKVGKKIIAPPKVGLETEHIAELKKLKSQKICVKYGVPFVPAFLLAFLLTAQWGNVVLRIMFG